MSKRIVAIMLLATLLVFLVSCANGEYSDILTDAKREQIKEAWSEKTGRDYKNHVDNADNIVCDMRYYGTYNGYDVLFSIAPAAVMSAETIGAETFEFGSAFVLYAYKDGVFYELKRVYESGFLTNEDIASIAEKHRNF